MQFKSLNRKFALISYLQSAVTGRMKQEIIDYLEDLGFQVDWRTIERDFNEIYHEFSLEKSYDKRTRKYRIAELADDEDHTDTLARLALMKRLYTKGELSAQLQSHTTSPYLKLEPQQVVRGIEYISPLLSACKQKSVLELTYQSYRRSEPRTYTFQPAIVLEHGNRWYATGLCHGFCTEEGSDKRYTFSLDRILNLIPSQHSFIKDGNDYHQILGKIYGVTSDDDDRQPVKIHLEVTTIQSKYLDSLPIHPSQNYLGEGKHTDMHIYQLNLVPNYEFIHALIGYGRGIKVVETSDLRNEIVSELQSMLRHYQDQTSLIEAALQVQEK
jgi:predicted DNA-binding transcriptional regulator YafY